MEDDFLSTPPGVMNAVASSLNNFVDRTPAEILEDINRALEEVGGYRVAYAVRLSGLTRRLLLERLKPYVRQVDTSQMSEPQIIALEFGGVRIETDESLVYRRVLVVDKNGEVIQDLMLKED
jgi:hypothetical protein